MLDSISIKGFKSLAQVDALYLAPLTVFFGPNAAGKSNVIDALVVLSRVTTTQTIADALNSPVRGDALELFAMPPDGLPGLLRREKAAFRLEATLRKNGNKRLLRYACEIGVNPASGALSLEDEYLARLTAEGKVKGNPVIERKGDVLRVRRKSKPGHPWEERVGLQHTLLSNRRYSGSEYRAIDEARDVLSGFRAYYLDAREALRRAQPPAEVLDIGSFGGNLAAFLYRLQAERPRHFDAVRRTVRELIPSIDDVLVDLDAKRGMVNIEIIQDGTPFSARVVSEGTLRMLALVSMAVNPWGGSLIAFEEPETGVHPRRLELIADIISNLALPAEGEGKQVVVTTHSPLFCACMARLAVRRRDQVALYAVTRRKGQTVFERFDSASPLFLDSEIRRRLADLDQDGVFEAALLRGHLDE